MTTQEHREAANAAWSRASAAHDSGDDRACEAATSEARDHEAAWAVARRAEAA